MSSSGGKELGATSGQTFAEMAVVLPLAIRLQESTEISCLLIFFPTEPGLIYDKPPSPQLKITSCLLWECENAPLPKPVFHLAYPALPCHLQKEDKGRKTPPYSGTVSYMMHPV